MHSIFLILLVWVLSDSSAAQDEYNCTAILDLDARTEVIIYSDSVQTKEVKRISHDFENEDYIVFEILFSGNQMYRVNASFAIRGFVANGWISKKSRLAVFYRAYDKELLIFDKPDSTSSYKSVGYISDALRILDIDQCWFKVEFLLEDEVVVGWIPPWSQCSNPYTTCN